MHGDGAGVYVEGQGGDRAERDNGARGRCIQVKGIGAERDLTVDGARVHGKVQEGTRERCTGEGDRDRAR